ncbi:hypothetical protein [Zhongshania aliphaticivorans]|uniref:hypothetical protein n=1 Tax=Zhongshania aliphaticivorans TaxID=1470434 RepID=UPI0012E5F0D9|nr:hypothetical protein [Zhongshania aliphaticivorans]CAA0102095.1 Uncharacterised protein [Zhongshania aliphaticivorans]
MILFRVVMGFGLLNCLLLTVAVVTPLTVKGLSYGWAQAPSLMIFHVLVSAAIVYATKEKMRGSDLGHKAFPASIMSYVLWLCMALRWLAQ